MNPRTKRSNIQSWTLVSSFTTKAILSTLTLLVLSSISFAKELPEAPSAVLASPGYVMETTVPVQAPHRFAETKPVDLKFVSLALIATGSTFADSYTTLFARQNWLAGKKGVCNIEVESAYLYGTHPTVVRTYAVASVKTVGAVAAAYYLRKHHSRLWSAPLLATSVISLQGVTQNMINCN
jgi:hypothetical protein